MYNRKEPMCRHTEKQKKRYDKTLYQVYEKMAIIYPDGSIEVFLEWPAESRYFNEFGEEC